MLKAEWAQALGVKGIYEDELLTPPVAKCFLGKEVDVDVNVEVEVEKIEGNNQSSGHDACDGSRGASAGSTATLVSVTGPGTVRNDLRSCASKSGLRGRKNNNQSEEEEEEEWAVRWKSLHEQDKHGVMVVPEVSDIDRPTWGAEAGQATLNLLKWLAYPYSPGRDSYWSWHY